MARLVAPGGNIVLSGLLRAQELPALGAYLPHGFALARRIPLEGWVTLVLERRTSARTAAPRTAQTCLPTLPAMRPSIAALRRAP